MNAVPWTAGGLIVASILFASLLFVGSWVRSRRGFDGIEVDR